MIGINACMILMFILIQAFVDLILTHVSLLKTFLHSARVQFSINCIVASFTTAVLRKLSLYINMVNFLIKKK